MNSAAGSSFNPDPTRRWIETELADQRIDGCALQVELRGESVFNEHIGVKNANGDPVTPDTRFWIASMTKPVVSVTVLNLIESNWLSFDDPVSMFIENFGDAGVLAPDGGIVSVSRPPTVFDLLTHTAGLTYGQFGNDEIHLRYIQSGAFDYSTTNKEMAEQLAQLPLLYQPGTTWEYGMSTDLLGRVIEVVTGQSLDRVLREIVFEPLGMLNTSFSPEKDAPAALAPSVVRDTIAPDFAKRPVWFSAGAGLFSTASDYMLFARMLLERGKLGDVRILSSESFSMMTAPSLPPQISYGEYTDSFGVSAPWEKNGLSFGLGLAVRTKELNSIPGGKGECFWPGISGANFWVDHKNELTVVFLTHAPQYRTTHRKQLRESIYRGIS